MSRLDWLFLFLVAILPVTGVTADALLGTDLPKYRLLTEYERGIIESFVTICAFCIGRFGFWGK